jgi:hypothetical protein
MHRLDFSTWDEFIQFSKRPSEMDSYSRASQREDVSWKGCTTREAYEYAEIGWLDGASRAKKFSDAIFNQIGHLIKRVDVNYDVVGDAVDIARFVNAEPDCWMKFETTLVDTSQVQHVRIVVNIVASAGIRAETIMARGAAVCALINLLEYAGRRCELVMVEATKSDEQHQCFVTLKKYEEQLDLPKIAYALAHPSVLRVHWMSAAETLPRHLRRALDIGGGYGIPADVPAQDHNATLYVGRMLLGESQWSSPERAVEWVTEQLKAQGVTLMSESK